MWIKRVKKTQPALKKWVLELEIGGPIGRWFYAHNWGAFTLPLPFMVLILYWTTEPQPDGNVHPLARVHEFVHAKQDEGNLFFLVSWVKYFYESARVFYWHGWGGIGQAFLDAYLANRLEIEAYTVESEAEKNGLPDWAK